MGDLAISLNGGRARVGGLRLLTDERLASMVAHGSEPAFAAIYERHHQALYRYCRSILGDSHDAGDALQSTMLNAFRALNASEKDVALRPWLFRIAHNESISLARRRRPAAALEEAEELAGPSLEGAVFANERLRQLFSDLGEITERQRGALVMRELSGLEYVDIAQALSISPAAAKQTVFEAHSALHELAEGRALDCDGVRESLSAGDRRLLRGRKLRAHLRHCDGCRSFQDGVTARRADLAALAPALPGGLAAALVQSLFGGGGGPDGGGGSGLLASAGGATAAAGGGSMATGGMTAATGGASAGGAVAGSGGGGGIFSGGLLGAAAGGGAPAVATSAAAKIVLPVAVITVGAQSIGLPQEARREPLATDRGSVSAPVEQRRVGPASPLDRALAEVGGGGSSLLPASAGLIVGGSSGGVAFEAAGTVSDEAPDGAPSANGLVDGGVAVPGLVGDDGAAVPAPAPDEAGPTQSTPDGAIFRSDGSSEFLSEGPRVGVPGPGGTPGVGSRPDADPAPSADEPAPVEIPQAVEPPRSDSGPPVAQAPPDRSDPVDPTQGTAGGGGSGGPVVEPDLDPDPDADPDSDPGTGPVSDPDVDNDQTPDEPIETDPEPDVDPLPGNPTAP